MRSRDSGARPLPKRYGTRVEALRAIEIGPLVLPGERAAALLALAAFALLAEASALRARRRGGTNDPRAALGDVAWAALLWGVLGARLGWVLTHLGAYRSEPWTALAFWQGGFAPWGFGAAALAFTLLRARREPWLPRAALAPALAGLAVWGGALLLLADDAPPPRLAELRAPLPPLDGGAPVAPAALEGAPLVVNLWATWCGPCRRELPLLAEAVRTEEGVRFLLVDQGEWAERVRTYLAREGLEALEPHILLDPAASLGAWARSPGLPTTLFFDAAGELRGRVLGEISRARLADELARIREP